jgi:hypothetical protein
MACSFSAVDAFALVAVLELSTVSGVAGHAGGARVG